MSTCVPRECSSHAGRVMPPPVYALLQSPSNPGSGMGANLIPAGGGAGFRVWAPNAGAVEVRLRSDAESAYQDLPLARDAAGSDYWSADVGGAVVGHRYRFRVTNSGVGPDNPGGLFEHVDPYARDVEHSGADADGFVVDPAFAFAPFETPRFEDFLIYQLHVGSFRGRNDDPGLNIVNFTATFRDIVPKLPYIAGLGFNAVQFLPTGEYPGDHNEGYAPSNFFAPESAYGPPDDMRFLVDQCHRNGLAVILDLVYNHVPDNDNNLWQFDGNRANDGGGIYFSGTRSENFGERPAFDRPAVHGFFLDNARMWFREYNVDGLRFDSAHNIAPDSALDWLIRDIAGEFPNKLLIAEHNNPDYCLAQHPFGAAWDMTSADDFRQALQARDVGRLCTRIDFEGVSLPFKLVRYLLGSHDQVFASYERTATGDISAGDHPSNRYFVERVGGAVVGRDDWTARAKARLGWALNAAMPATPMLFMGSEVHHYGYWCPDTDFYGDHRFDWNLTRDPIGNEMQTLVRDANRLRWERPALRAFARPQFTHVDPDNGVIAFKRWNDQGDIVLTVVNLGDRQFNDAAYGVSLGGDGGTWEEVFNSQSPQYGGWNDSGNYQAFPSVQNDGRIYIRLPKLAVLVFRKV
jgi:1,4-alpha-glucan branching enzyme